MSIISLLGSGRGAPLSAVTGWSSFSGSFSPSQGSETAVASSATGNTGNVISNNPTSTGGNANNNNANHTADVQASVEEDVETKKVGIFISMPFMIRLSMWMGIIVHRRAIKSILCKGNLFQLFTAFMHQGNEA